MKVYVTYDNDKYRKITGIYLDKELAIKERDQRNDLPILDEFEVKGEKKT